MRYMSGPGSYLIGLVDERRCFFPHHEISWSIIGEQFEADLGRSAFCRGWNPSGALFFHWNLSRPSCLH
jgi:hypothetical protein